MVPSTPRPELPDALLELVLEGPAVRAERVAEVARRLAAGDRPDADELADALVRDTRAQLDVGA